MKWLAAPLVALTILGGSGFVSGLAATTESSVALAESSKEAPRTTAQAERQVNDLPAIAELTTRQAQAFETLADALEVSARRVFNLNDTIDKQSRSIADLRDSTSALIDPIECVRSRLSALNGIATTVPSRLRSIVPVLSRLIDAQRKSLRHLRSINRKLTALGVAARASHVKVPPVPDTHAPGTTTDKTSAPSC